MNKNIDIKFIVIIVLVIIVVLQQQCGRSNKKDYDIINIGGKEYELISHKIDTVYIPQIKTVVKPGSIIYVDTTIYVQLPVNIDTIEVIRNYYNKTVYMDTLVLDNNLGAINIVDTITQNSIQTRKWEAKINQTIIKDEIIVNEPPTRQLYYGIQTQLSGSELFKSLGVGLALKDKQDHMYQFNVGVINELGSDFTPYIGVGAYWKIKFKKQ